MLQFKLKKMNKIKKISLVLGLIMLVLVTVAIIHNSYLENQKEGMSISYYKDGKKVDNSLFSVSPPGTLYDQIRLTISGNNDGTLEIFNMSIIDADPIELRNALPKVTQNLNVGQSKILWVSSLINVSQLVIYHQPVRLFVNVSGEAEGNQKLYKPYELYLNVTMVCA